MATKKKLPAKKAKPVTVRVLKSKKAAAPTIKSETEEKSVLNAQATKRETSSPKINPAKKMQYVWIGAVTSFVVIIAGWITFLNYAPEKKGGNDADDYLYNIGHTLSQAVTDFDKTSAEIKLKFLNISDSIDRSELDELKQRAFPQFYK